MIHPTFEDIGRKVVYRPAHGKAEEGVITSLQSGKTFVRYGTGSTSALTKNTDLEWVMPLGRDFPMLPARCCGHCVNWTRANPDDLTAPEGRCNLPTNPGHWPTGYWPATLQRDGCRKFKPAKQPATVE